jgi:ribosomal protein S18 acetylase RimI-like enzyme
MDYQVRRIAVPDWPELRRLRLEALKDSPLAFLERYDESVAKPDEFWRGRAQRGAAGGAAATFVAEVATSGRFLGKATGYVNPDVTGRVKVEVVGVYVSPEHRGSGVAEALVARVVRWAGEEAGADRIGLYVVDNNERAARFYRRLGFVPTGHTVPYPHDPAYREIQMVLRSGVRPGPGI